MCVCTPRFSDFFKLDLVDKKGDEYLQYMQDK